MAEHPSKPRRAQTAAMSLLAILAFLIVVWLAWNGFRIMHQVDTSARETEEGLDELWLRVEKREALFSENPDVRHQAQLDFEQAAASGDLSAQDDLIMYWLKQDERRYDKVIQWTLISLSCVSGAEKTGRSTPGLGYEVAAMGAARKLRVASVEENEAGVQLARLWFEQHAENASLEFCDQDQIDLYESLLDK